jgi:cyclase
MVIDTQSDLPHARQMIEMFGKVWPAMPNRVVNTHEDAEITGHRSLPERMKVV